MEEANEENYLKSNIFKSVKNKYILQRIFSQLNKNKSLKIITHNKLGQDKLEIGIDDYKKEFNKVIIEIIPKRHLEGNIKFINISSGEDSSHYHIFFNERYKETKNTFFTKDDFVTKIKVILDQEFRSFSKLFNKCENIEKINFIKFNRNDITDMNYMFSNCFSLKELNLSHFNTENVTDIYS